MNYDLPQRIFCKGTLADIPKFHPVQELLKAGRYAKFGHTENTSDNKLYVSVSNNNLDKCLAVLEGKMTAYQVSEKLCCAQSSAYKWLTTLVDIGKADRKKARVDGYHTILFWRIK